MFTLNQFAPSLDEEGNLLSDRKPVENAYASNASAGTSKAYDSVSGPAAAAPNASNSGFNSTPINAEEDYGKPEKTSYPEEGVGGRF